jgi:ABC-type uncharacterized transport system involved in gliding motility auxiliary subunit
VVGHRRFDVTAGGQFTLTPQTQRILKELQQPVTALGFFPATATYQAAKRAAENLLAEYRYHSSNLDYQFVDPETQPAIARQYRVKDYGTIMFVGGGRQKAVRLLDERVFAAPEQFFTGALLEVTGVQQKTVYFLTGHGERSVNSTGKSGYSLARMGLIRDLYRAEILDLARTPEVPGDCAVLILAGPDKGFREAEIRAVEKYLERSGKLLVLVDPNPPPEVTGLLANWGVAVGQGRIVDEGAFVEPDKTTPAVLRGTYPPVVVAQGTIAVLPLAVTTASSWLEIDATAGQFDEGVDTKGPLALGCLVMAGGPLRRTQPPASPTDKLTRLAVIGDSDFATNEHFTSGGNSDLFLNAVNWLAEEEQLISIRPKPFTFRRLLASKEALRFMRFSSVGLLPLAVLLAGGFVWWRRR